MRTSHIAEAVTVTALGLAGGLAVGPKGPWIAVLLVVAGTALMVAVVARYFEWIGDRCGEIEEGAGLLWPVAVQAHSDMKGEDEDETLDRAALRAVAEAAGYPTESEESEGLMGLATYLYPRYGADKIDQTQHDRVERARILIRDAILSLAGRRIKRKIAGWQIPKRLDNHVGTTMLYWYIETALAHQHGATKVANYDVIAAFAGELRRYESRALDKPDTTTSSGDSG